MANTPLSDSSLNQLFREARTRNGWERRAVPETLIMAVYDLTKMGPTSANCSPARFTFIGSPEGKDKLRPFLAPGNVDKTMGAPWTVIISTDMEFYEKMPQLFPHNPGSKDWFNGSPEITFDAGFRNGTLQGAYLMLAARSLGLDCGPMSGFDREGVDNAFFAGSPATAAWKSNFLCNLGYGDDTNLFPRSPRLSFEEACQIL
jgi:3-hydroxypropanoate dehydrogenase